MKSYQVSEQFIKEMYESKLVCITWKNRIEAEFPDAFKPSIVRFTKKRDDNYVISADPDYNPECPVIVAYGAGPREGFEEGTTLKVKDGFRVVVKDLKTRCGATGTYIYFEKI